MTVQKTTNSKKPNPNTITLNELPWVAEARHHEGLKEIRGVRHHATITRWLKRLGAWWTDDETPWCGTFVAHCLTTAKRGIPRHWYRAKAYADNYGTRLAKPAYGCLGVMSRQGGGHVCFVIGKTSGDRLVVIGGNQNNQVSIAIYPRSRFDAFVWAERAGGVPSLPYRFRYDLPVYEAGNYRQPVSEA